MIKHYPQGVNLVSDVSIPVPANTGALLTVSNTSYAVYVGRAPKNCSSVDLLASLGNPGAVTITWAEIAVASGDYEPASGPGTSGTPNLTTLGFADIAAEINGTANDSIVKTVTAAIPAGTNIWVLIGNQAATPATFRTTGGGDVLGICATAAATRPSTMAAGTAFTAGQIDAAVTTPLLGIRWR
jgi:hypothetical protein